MSAGVAPAQASSSYPEKADGIHQTLVLGQVHPWADTPAEGEPWPGEIYRWDAVGHKPELNDIIGAFWPARGLYSAVDPQHAAQVGEDLERAGVNVGVITWADFYPGEQQKMENLLQNMGKKAIVQVEATWNRPPSLAEMQDRVNTVLGYAKQRDRYPNYYRDPRTGKPVVFVHSPGRSGSIEEWNEFINWHKTKTAEEPIFVATVDGGATPTTWCRQSLFDGCRMLGHKTTVSDQASIEGVLWQLHGQQGSRGQFLIAQAVPGFDFRTHCFVNLPVIDRDNGAVFDRKWSGVVNASWNGHQVAHAEVMYNNDGESAGIEPASSNPPVREPGYESCDGRVPPNYDTYGERKPTYYLDRTAYWAGNFRSSRPGANAR